MRSTLVSRFHLFLVLILGVITAIALYKVPADAQLAFHWTMHGDADWALGRNAGFLVLPGAALVLTGACALLSLRQSQADRQAYGYVSEPALTCALLLIDGFQFGLVLSALGSDIDLIRILGCVAATGLCGCALVLGTAELGVYNSLRLPWRISPASVFRPLHRLAGVLHGIAGLGLAALCWQSPFPGYIIGATGIALAAPLMLAYVATLAFGRRKPV